MIMTSAAQEGYSIVWLLLLFASAGVFHHAGIKIPFFAFFAHDSGIRCREAPPHMLIAMTLAAALCIAIGVFPAALYGVLPLPMSYEPYTSSHVLAQLQLLVFSALAFSWLMRNGIYPPELRALNLDTDWLHRRAGLRFVEGIDAALQSRFAAIGGVARAVASAGEGALARFHDSRSVLARTWPTGSMALGIMIMLLA